MRISEAKLGHIVVCNAAAVAHVMSVPRTATVHTVDKVIQSLFTSRSTTAFNTLLPIVRGLHPVLRAPHCHKKAFQVCTGCMSSFQVIFPIHFSQVIGLYHFHLFSNNCFVDIQNTLSVSLIFLFQKLLKKECILLLRIVSPFLA